ncbi:MAG: TIGR02281 family clan AA aspartic protease [Gammaproteobacteria bacterium]|nr:TIGR02281 family clan AA aspartic protease [Gammaproteobacteria bacterium]
MRAIVWLFGLALLGAVIGANALAAPSVRVLALFPGKAMLEIDGKRKVLAAGERGPQGVRLVSADTREAVVEIDGRRETLRLGSAVSATYKAPETNEIRVLKRNGGYFLDGLINGRPVRFLVDTGATSVALSEVEARRLGIQHRLEGTAVGVGTAGGTARAHAISLRSLSVGGVRLDDVRAVVIEGESPRHVLLGMNVLSRFDIDQRDNLLILRSKF